MPPPTVSPPPCFRLRDDVGQMQNDARRLGKEKRRCGREEEEEEVRKRVEHESCT